LINISKAHHINKYNSLHLLILLSKIYLRKDLLQIRESYGEIDPRADQLTASAATYRKSLFT